MKVSIIIPCYNIEPYLSKCIDSVLNQTFSDFELILINDGSTDRTLNVCQEYKNTDDRIKVYSQENKGVSYTRNRGIDLAQGDYIMFIDGDDYIKTDFVEQHLQFAKIGVWPVSGITIITNESTIDRSQSFLELLDNFPSGVINKKNLIELIVFGSISSPCARLYCKHDLIQQNIKFAVHLSYQEDLMFNIEYLQCINEIQLMNYFGYYYVKNLESSSSKYHKYFDHLPFLMDKLEEIAGNKQSLEILKPFLFDTMLKKISNCFHKHSNKDFKMKGIEINYLFASKYYNYLRASIFKFNINFIYKILLYFRMYKGLYIYFLVHNLSKKG